MSRFVLSMLDAVLFRVCFGFWKSELRALYATLVQRDDFEFRSIEKNGQYLRVQNTAFSLEPYEQTYSIQADYETAQRLKVFKKTADGWQEEFNVQAWTRADKKKSWYEAVRKLL